MAQLGHGYADFSTCSARYTLVLNKARGRTRRRQGGQGFPLATHLAGTVPGSRNLCSEFFSSLFSRWTVVLDG